MDFLTERRPNNWAGSAGERMTIHHAGLRGQRGRGRGGYQQRNFAPSRGSNTYHRGPPPQRYDPRQTHYDPRQQQQRYAPHPQAPPQGSRYPAPRYPPGYGQPQYPPQPQAQQQRYPPSGGGYGPPLGVQPPTAVQPTAPAVDPRLLQQAQLLVQQLQGQSTAAYHRPPQPVQPISFFNQQQQQQQQPGPGDHPPYQP